tara:strand:+ start:259 stop:465 length:207 start_codon:yes stop_codon:yes gene_type:complete
MNIFGKKKTGYAQRRMAICRNCPSVRNTPGVGLTCGSLIFGYFEPDNCGCIIALKVKMKNESCPQGKW